MVFVLLSKLFCFAGWSIAAAGNVMLNTKRTIALVAVARMSEAICGAACPWGEDPGSLRSSGLL
jgi:hypothetical protein